MLSFAAADPLTPASNKSRRWGIERFGSAVNHHIGTTSNVLAQIFFGGGVNDEWQLELFGDRHKIFKREHAFLYAVVRFHKQQRRRAFADRFLKLPARSQITLPHFNNASAT